MDVDTVFCPNCGAANFQRNSPASRVSSDSPSPAFDPVEIPSQSIPKKANRKMLFLSVIAALAALFVLFLIWDPFSPAEDPQLSVKPSTEQTVPSTTSPKIYIDPTATTSPATRPTQTQPPETEPLPTLLGEPLAQDQLQEYANELTSNGFLNCATTSVFSHPKEVNLYLLFYNGISQEIGVLTVEEFAHFSAKNESFIYMDVNILPPDNMNEILTNYFGITLEETDKRGLDKFQHWDKTGNYYWFGMDANGNWDIEVLAGSTLSDGSVQILYSSSGACSDAGLSCETRLWIITFSPEGKVFSNLPA